MTTSRRWRSRFTLVALTLAALVVAVNVARRYPVPTSAAPADSQPEKGHEPSTTNAKVTLSEAAMSTAQIVVESVRIGAEASDNPGLEVPAQIEFDPRRVAVVSPRSEGRVERLSVVEGDRVGANDAVAHINSKEFLVAQSDLQQAARRASLLAGSGDAAGATALVQASRRRLTLLGVSDSAIALLEAGAEPLLYLPLTAPFAGSVIKAHVLSGQAVGPGDPVFTIADVSVVDVIAEVPERSLPLVRVGQSATVSVAAFPDQPFAGEVERLRDELNPETRTVKAVIHVPNVGGRLRAGMFASVRLALSTQTFAQLRSTPASEQSVGSLTIPESAIVNDGATQYVFVQTAPRTFERREVRIASLAPHGSSVVNARFVVVQSGLRATDRIVTRGAFTLKSELAKSGLGEH